MNHKRQLIRWLIAMLNSELDDTQLFPEQRAEILRYLDAARDLDEMVLRQRQAQVNGDEIERQELRLAELRKEADRMDKALAKRKARYWKGRVAA